MGLSLLVVLTAFAYLMGSSKNGAMKMTALMSPLQLILYMAIFSFVLPSNLTNFTA